MVNNPRQLNIAFANEPEAACRMCRSKEVVEIGFRKLFDSFRESTTLVAPKPAIRFL